MIRSSRHAVRSTVAAAAGVVCLVAGAAGAAEGATSEAAVELIRKTADEVIEILNDEALDSAARRSRIEKIAYERFDFNTMSKLVIARYWKKFTPEQQEEVVKQFTDFLAKTYGDRIDRYSNEQVEIVGNRPEGRGDIVVLTRIVGGQYEGAEVNYRLRNNAGQWRVIDVKVEGISLVLNYRDQFKSILSRKGPDGLIEALRKKNAEVVAVHEG